MVVRDGRLPLRRGQNPLAPRLPAHEPAVDSRTLRGKSGSHAARGRTTVSWDRCPQSARNGILTLARLAYTSPRTGVLAFGKDGRRSGTDSSRANGTQPPASRQGWHPHRLWPVTRVLRSLSSSRPRRDPDPGAASTHVAQDRSLGAREAGPTQPVEGHTFPAIEIAEPTEVRPGPSAASTHIARDRSVAVREGRLLLTRGENPMSPRLSAPEPAEDSLLLRGRAGTHTACGRSPVSCDHFRRAAQGGTRTPARLAHTSRRTGA